MGKTLLSVAGGLVAGVLLMSIALYLLAPGMMLTEQRSPLSLDETTAALEKAATEAGWVVSSIARIDRSVREHGGPEVAPVRLVNLCHADHAGRILQDDSARVVSVMMPCTISVYEKSDGSVWIASMNPGLVGKLFGGVISEVMAGPVAEQQASFLRSVTGGA